MSGGLDSMVMLRLFKDAGMNIGVAHCNFQLRGREADEDEAFVTGVCRQYNVPCHTAAFDTRKTASDGGISIQMAARDLRYDFFQQIAERYEYDLIATAHHFDDNIESVFLNLIRGTGVDGVRGIANRKDNIIRPMLFANRQMILAYAQKHDVIWREDASNETDDYPRNFVRHQVIPRLEELNPSFRENFRETHERLLGAREYALAFIQQIRASVMDSRPDGSIIIAIERLRQLPYPAVLLWELIKDSGFRYDQCKRITADHQPGKIFFSETHQLVVDRSTYILQRKAKHEFVSSSINRGDRFIENRQQSLHLRELPVEDFALEKDSRIAQLDADKLQFPLVWRRWRSGDYFVPLGMHVEKKVSDFLIDLKIPFNHKADITVLESGAEIVWIVGYRISDRHKVTPETRRVLVIRKGAAAD